MFLKQVPCLACSDVSNPHLTISPALSAMATLDARTLIRAGDWPDTEDIEDMLRLRGSWAMRGDERRQSLGCKMR